MSIGSYGSLDFRVLLLQPLAALAFRIRARGALGGGFKVEGSDFTHCARKACDIDARHALRTRNSIPFHPRPHLYPQLRKTA